MAKRQEAAIARKAAERETALQLQQRVARLREQRRIEYERKRQERLERAASQEENRRLEQNRKQQERIAREEERRARAIQDEEKRKEAAAYAAAKLAEASKPETQSESATKEIPDETAKSSAEPDTRVLNRRSLTRKHAPRGQMRDYREHMLVEVSRCLQRLLRNLPKLAKQRHKVNLLRRNFRRAYQKFFRV